MASKEQKLEAIAKMEKREEETQREAALHDTLEFFGGVKMAQALTKAVNTQLIRGLERMQEAKVHEQLGYSRFDDLLDKWERSPMSSDKYYRQRELLYSEGEHLFDLMSAIKLPERTRKLLKGQMEVEGDELVVGDHRLSLTDTATLKAVLKDVAFQQERTNQKLTKQEKEIKDLKAKLVETVNAAKQRPADETARSPYGMALLVTLTAINNLSDEVAQLSDADRLSFRQSATDQIGEATRRLQEAFGFTVVAPQNRDVTDADLAEMLGDD